MKDKIGIVLGIVVVAAVIVSLSLYILNVGNLRLDEIFPIGIVLIIIISTLYILWDRIKNIKKGFPAKDERIINISYKAGYYGFISAIWSAVFGPVVIDILFRYELESSRVSALVVIVSGFIFMISFLYIYWKGN